MSETIGTACVQGGYRPGDGEPRQIPIYQSTTWKFDTSEHMGRLFDLEESGYFYTRLANPTNDFVAAKIAELEGGTAAMLLMIALMLPCFFLAMYERDGLPAEKVLKNILRATVLTPRVRPYQTQNFYLYLSNHGKEVQPIDRKKSKTARKKP